eukprot:1161733-Pelagomonas_calceolata.AAC.1
MWDGMAFICQPSEADSRVLLDMWDGVAAWAGISGLKGLARTTCVARPAGNPGDLSWHCHSCMRRAAFPDLAVEGKGLFLEINYVQPLPISIGPPAAFPRLPACVTGSSEFKSFACDTVRACTTGSSELQSLACDSASASTT